jgi:hypothetical protein
MPTLACKWAVGSFYSQALPKVEVMANITLRVYMMAAACSGLTRPSSPTLPTEGLEGPASLPAWVHARVSTLPLFTYKVRQT